VIARRGTRATLFQGLDGLDELSTSMPSVIYEVQNHTVRKRMFDPDDLGIDHAKAADLKGGDIDTNVAIARGVLDGESGPRRDIVLLNAAAALQVAGVAENFADGMARAAESIDSGKAAAVLDRWVEVSNA
jgi:anthranilate phosphoribosyltransferase